MLFEIGCEFVGDNDFLLTDERFGFWAWFKYLYVKDDGSILHTDYTESGLQYFEMKRALIGDKVMIELFNTRFKHAEQL